MPPGKSPLSATMRAAAQSLGEGRSKTDCASELKLSRRTLSNYWARDDFKKLVAEHRERALNDADPSVLGVVRAALLAVDSRGKPLWRDRLSAARILLQANGPDVRPPDQPHPIVWAKDLENEDEDFPGVGVNRMETNGGDPESD